MLDYQFGSKRDPVDRQMFLQTPNIILHRQREIACQGTPFETGHCSQFFLVLSILMVDGMRCLPITKNWVPSIGKSLWVGVSQRSRHHMCLSKLLAPEPSSIALFGDGAFKNLSTSLKCLRSGTSNPRTDQQRRNPSRKAQKRCFKPNKTIDFQVKPCRECRGPNRSAIRPVLLNEPSAREQKKPRRSRA